ncbi:2,3-bisphosphoglycerate-dependent phosphoglycerate mutase [Bombiscardovia apis]|uniref:2,3-bisphosphoglycerate-dependent phosphoglycerate mutase n=1 Tax=Bombiscardovia apis TaxID=2932182 RepID=A0ABN6SFC3_9BIFI|nr:2,3-bisphosphoglycerate-dependent phosphoglycerate mutase [Bombiscardovia apis]BDR54717.1 2,3-bisphosphoglycerate-dependent phosphoglycerate mutase [Bombiscardovia apis]
MDGKLILMRHGQSEWTRSDINRFAGWVDIPLSEWGKQQARQAGQLIQNADLKPDCVFTSLLRRSIESSNLALDMMNRLWVPVQRSWRLNERHYGAFQGQTRPDMLAQYGQRHFGIYRRSYDVAPPALSVDSPYWQGQDSRYSAPFLDHLDQKDPACITAESLSDVLMRFLPYWQERILPLLASGQTVFVVTHGSVVRATIKMLEQLSDHDIQYINVPTGIPLVYRFVKTTHSSQLLETIEPGRYLDPVAAKSGIAHVEALGQGE